MYNPMALSQDRKNSNVEDFVRYQINPSPNQITSKYTCLVEMWDRSFFKSRSSRFRVCSEFFKMFSPSSPYSLRTCAVVKETIERRASAYVTESRHGTVHLWLPSLVECNGFPNNRDGIPTPSAGLHHSPLKSVAHLIIDQNTPITILLGQDIIKVYEIRKQINGPQDELYV